MDLNPTVFVILILVARLPVSISDALNCSHSSIKFPFGFEGQNVPREFTLRCNDKFQAVLNIPSAGNFIVQRIDLNEQTIALNSSDGCYPNPYLDGYLRATPFTFANSTNYRFYNCPTNSSAAGINKIPCSGNVTTIAIPTFSTTEETAVCVYLVEASVGISLSGWDFSLTWQYPDCKACYKRGGICYSSGGIYIPSCTVFSPLPPTGSSLSVNIYQIWGTLIVMMAVISWCCICAHMAKTSDYTTSGGRNADIAGIVRVQGVGSSSDHNETHVKANIKAMVLGQSMRLAGSEENCAICLSEFEALQTVGTIAGCKHVFHFECLEEWMTKSDRCPLCRNQAPEVS